MATKRKSLRKFNLRPLATTCRSFISRKNANYASNNGMYIKRGKVRIKRIGLDLHDVIADSKKVVVFEYEIQILANPDGFQATLHRPFSCRH